SDEDAPLLPLTPPARAASLAPPGSRVTGPDGAAGAAPPAAAAPSRLAPTSAGASSAVEPGAAASAADDPSTFFSRHDTNCPSSFVLTSAITPRPNWAARPVIARSVTTVTRVPLPSDTRVAVTVALALP